MANGRLLYGARQTSLTAGIVHGAPIAIGESLEELVHIAATTAETYNVIKSLINSSDILGYGTLSKVNCLKKLSDMQYAMVSLDFIKAGESLNAAFGRENYNELMQKGFKKIYFRLFALTGVNINRFLSR